MRYIFSICICLLAFGASTFSQSKRQWIDVRVVPTKANWEYSEKEEVAFYVSVVKDGHPVSDVEISYQYGYERMNPEKKVLLKSSQQPMLVQCGKFSKPGFVTLEASVEYNGKTYKGRANAAVNPHLITPVSSLPQDFESYWKGEIEKLKSVPLEPNLIHVPEKSTAKYHYYYVDFQNNKVGSRIYGVLTVPKGEGKFPAILNVPGAGVRSYNGDGYLSVDGFISLTIGIHGIPVNLPDEVYASLSKGALDKYWVQNMDSREDYYYKRVYLGCIRAVDFIFSLAAFNGSDLAVSGGSQGGALAIVTGALDQRVKCLTSFYPALCDLTGFLHDRAGGWPQLFKGNLKNEKNLETKVEVLSYFDVVNFARILKAPGFYSWGYNDDVCPPTSVYAAFNAVNAPKTKAVFFETEHWNYSEQWDEKQQFIKNTFKAN